jgi:uncharacterized protein YndB with AHSA1/START domain
MTRFGTMKHLKILEEAGLVTTRKVGREKRHYLNPVPIQQVYDRWVSKYAQRWTRTLTGLKYALEDTHMAEKPTHVFQIYIRTTPENLWRALTDGAITQQYYFGTRVESSWESGALYRCLMPDGSAMVEGQVLEIDPPRRLVTTFMPLWTGSAEGAAPSRVTWEIEPVGDACKLTLTHDDLDPNAPMTQGVVDGWTQILSSLKTLLETGKPLVIEG